MATTDTRSGFRLPWSADRPHEDLAGADAADSAFESTAAAASDPADAFAWPQSDSAAPQDTTPGAFRPFEPAADQGEPMPDAADVPPATLATPAPAAPKKPSKLMTDLAAAIRATTEAARDQRLAQVDTEATAIVELIRAQSTEGAAALRRRSDDDVAAIRDWAKAEIARIREESDSRVATRKHLLEGEITTRAVAIEDRVGEVETVVTGYRAAMQAYFGRLVEEQDPARLATLAETMPEPPSLDLLADLDNLPLAPAAVAPVEAAPVEAVVAEPAVASAEAELAPVEPVAFDEPVASAEADVAPVQANVTFEPDVAFEADMAPVEAVSDEEYEPVTNVDAARLARATGWSDEPDTAFTPQPKAAAEAAPGTVETSDATQRWTADEAPAGFPEPETAGDPVDRGAIMAALEAAAEAVVAAESAAESADQAEAAAGVAETAAELLVGRHDVDEDDPEAQAALSARVDAGGYETESFADRLASLLPSHAEGAADGEPRTTQVVVNGLVSVASIASFKRHLARLPGVTAVAVASGPDGEFVFNVTHRPDVSFRDVIPTMPGFAARVTATGDRVVSVTARDPDSEG